MKMHDEFGLVPLDQCDKSFGFGLARGVRAGVVTRGFGVRAPVFRWKISIQVDSASVGALVFFVTVDIETGDQQPVVNTDFVVFLQPAEQLRGQFDTFGLITMNSSNKKNWGRAVTQ